MPRCKHALSLSSDFWPRIAGGHVWSLAVTAHAYLALPLALLVLRPRVSGLPSRLAVALVATILGGSLYRYWMVSQLDLRLPISMHPSEGELFANYINFFKLYLPTSMRMVNLAAGVAAGCLLGLPGGREWLGRRCAPMPAAC